MEGKAGFLIKEGAGPLVRTWKRRYFELAPAPEPAAGDTANHGRHSRRGSANPFPLLPGMKLWTLVYRESPELMSHRGSIDLSAVTSIRAAKHSETDGKKAHIFLIETKRRVYRLQAADEPTRDEWINALSRASPRLAGRFYSLEALKANPDSDKHSEAGTHGDSPQSESMASSEPDTDPGTDATGPAAPAAGAGPDTPAIPVPS